MTALPISKRGTITLPPEIRNKLGLEQVENPMVLVEEREGGIFLQPAIPVPIRNFSKKRMQEWIKEDETAMKRFRQGND